MVYLLYVLGLFAGFEGVFGGGDGGRKSGDGEHGTVAEGGVAYLLEVSGEDYLAEIFAFCKGFGTYDLQSIRENDLTQVAATMECTFVNSGKCLIELHLTEADTLRKDVLTQLLECYGQRYFFEHFALLERTFFDDMQVVHKVNMLQLLAVLKGIFANTECRNRDIDAL